MTVDPFEFTFNPVLVIKLFEQHMVAGECEPGIGSLMDTLIIELCSLAYHYQAELVNEGQCFRGAKYFIEYYKIKVRPGVASAINCNLNNKRQDVIFGGTFLKLLLESYGEDDWPADISGLQMPKNKEFILTIGNKIRSILVHAISMNAVEIW